VLVVIMRRKRRKVEAVDQLVECRDEAAEKL
jgi:hypothetical protein